MNDVYAAAVEVQRFCDDRGWPNCVIGGLAVVRWGEPRVTQDADLSVLTGFGREREIAEQFLAAFRPRYDDAVEFAVEHRVLLLFAANGVQLDLGFAGFPMEEDTIARASDFEFVEETVIRTCSAEDPVLMKVFAGRGQDWKDVEGILRTQGGRLDRLLIDSPLEGMRELFEDDRLATLNGLWRSAEEP